MDLESIILSDVSQRKTNATWYHLYVQSKKYKKKSEYNKIKAKQNKETDPHI